MDMYVEFPKDLPAEWNDSVKLQRAIEKEFASQGIDAQIEWKHNPLAAEKDRELVLVILATGAAAVMAAHAIKIVLDKINPGVPTVVYEKESEPVLDKDGKPVLGADGHPVMKTKETPIVLPPPGGSSSLYLNVLKVFEFRSSTGQNDEPAHPAVKPGQGKST
jgi:hypothetical protein